MSRIDEALNRSGVGPAGAPLDQQPFTPPWTVDDAVAPGERSAPEPVTAGLAVPTPAPERPSVFHAPVPRRADMTMAFSSAWQERLAIGPNGDPALTEQFRHVAATLRHAQQTSGLNSVMVTSAEPGDGKTLTAINLALVLSESYRYNVLLIDADLRRPSTPSVLEVGVGSGLSDVLRSPVDQKLALIQVTAGLTLLPAGHPVANSIEALTSPRMQLIMQEATDRFDWVILDAPPVGPTADAHLLAQMVGGTLFVIRAGRTQSGEVQNAIKALGREQILGVILNGVEPSDRRDYYYAADVSEMSKA